jgi:hypothetical protein
MTITALSLAGSVGALVFIPPDPDLEDLVHQKYYIWGMDWLVPAGETIESASVTFYNIYNWREEPDDCLWLHLLGSAPAGLSWGYDNQTTGSYFASPAYTGDQILLQAFTNLPEGYASRADVTYDFDAAELGVLSDYALDGNFGLGFDPDCHYYNSGVEFRVETMPIVPEPGTLGLMALGLVSLVGLGRRRFQKQ